jgi:excisionase family DNA binding protein
MINVYLTPKRVVEALRAAGYPLPASHACAAHHVAGLADTGRLPAVRTAGKHRRFSPNAVNQFIRDWQAKFTGGKA